MNEVRPCWQCVHGVYDPGDPSVGIDGEWMCGCVLEDECGTGPLIPDGAGETVPCPLFEENDWRDQLAEEEEWHRILAEEDNDDDFHE